MSTVTDVLRTYPKVIAALRRLVEAHTAGDPTTDEAIAQLQDAVAEAEQLLEQPAIATAVEPPAPAPAPAAKAAKPARKKTARKKAARRRPQSPPSAEGDGDGGPPPDAKRCGTCRTIKPAAEFNRNKATKDGLHPDCRPCHRGKQRAARARKKSGAKASSGDGDKEGSPVPAADIVTRRPAPHRAHVTGKRPVIVKSGTSGAEAPLPGAPAFTVTLTCSSCPLESKSTHPRADDPDAIVAMWRRVEQSLHGPCPGTLSATAGDAVDPGTLSGAQPTARRHVSTARALG